MRTRVASDKKSSGLTVEQKNMVFFFTDFCIFIRTTTIFTFRNSTSICGQKCDLDGAISRHEARTAEADSGRVGRGEQCEASPGNSAPRGVDLRSSSLEDGSKSRFYNGPFGCPRATSA